MNPYALTIADIATNYYLPEKSARRRANTVAGYESSLALHVLPAFGELAIAQLDRDRIQEWVDSIASQGTPGAAWKAYKCLRQVVRWAIRKWSMLVIDPTIGIERPRAAAYRPATLDSSALTERLRGMMGCVHEATHILSAALGLRPGEAYALEWRDIDWREGRVTVNKTLQQVKGKLYVYPTKTAKGDRVLYLPKWAKVRLHAIWTAQSRPKGRIIGDATPVSVSGVIKRYAAKHGLPAVTMQNLRHTWATLAMEAGVAIETIAMNLGHSSLDMAYAHYMTPRKGVLVDAQKAVSKLLGM